MFVLIYPVDMRLKIFRTEQAGPGLATEQDCKKDQLFPSDYGILDTHPVLRNPAAIPLIEI